ncbi:MAG: nicotinamide riboside transporter PnuC [Gammaproteobacteria bacterium]|nr:nicotinamide riboside transporter PnuC [Gammaproteobacteria bacterium]
MSAWIEYFAVAAGIGYALLAVRRIRWAWVFGGISSALLAWLAARSALPLQSALQTVYVGMAVYGFWQWTARSKKSEITRWPLWVHACVLIAIAAASLVLSPALAETTGASWPRLDAAVTGASLLATWMTARSVLENWLYWFAVNAASMFLYGVQGLSWVAGLYVVYFIIAIFGWREWLAEYRLR